MVDPSFPPIIIFYVLEKARATAHSNDASESNFVAAFDLSNTVSSLLCRMDRLDKHHKDLSSYHWNHRRDTSAMEYTIRNTQSDLVNALSTVKNDITTVTTKLKEIEDFSKRDMTTVITGVLDTVCEDSDFHDFEDLLNDVHIVGHKLPRIENDVSSLKRKCDRLEATIQNSCAGMSRKIRRLDESNTRLLDSITKITELQETTHFMLAKLDVLCCKMNVLSANSDASAANAAISAVKPEPLP